KFGRMQLVKTGMEMQTAGLAKLGPEPKEETFIVEDFSKNLKRRKKAIKNALLDQTIVAGLGNIYADEELWMSKIHLETPGIRSYTDAFRHSGGFQFSLHAYQRTGDPCERCGTPIQRIVVGQRGTHFCPKCQVVKL